MGRVHPLLDAVWALGAWGAESMAEAAQTSEWLLRPTDNAPKQSARVEVDAAAEIYREHWSAWIGRETSVAEWGFADWIGFEAPGIRHPVAEYMERMTSRQAPAIPLRAPGDARGPKVRVQFRGDLTALTIDQRGRHAEGSWRLEGRHIVVDTPDGEFGRWPAIGFGRWLHEAGLLP